MSLERIVSYAQNREDLLLASFLKDVEEGFYVDVGANDPLIDSATKYFYDKGWTGINIEPVESCFQALEKDRPNDINLQIGISDKEGELDFTEYESSGLSTFSDEIVDEHKKADDAAKVKSYKVPVKTLKQVLDQHKVKKIHFLKVDVEGFEYEVLEGNDWKKYRPEVICIEANHIVKDWRPLLEKHDYIQVFNDGLNDYYLAKESHDRLKLFDYAEDLIVNKRVLSYGVHVEFESILARVAELTKLLDDAEKKIKKLEAKLNKDSSKSSRGLFRRG